MCLIAHVFMDTVFFKSTQNALSSYCIVHSSQFTGRYQVKIADQGTVAANLGKMHSSRGLHGYPIPRKIYTCMYLHPAHTTLNHSLGRWTDGAVHRSRTGEVVCRIIPDHPGTKVGPPEPFFVAHNLVCISQYFTITILQSIFIETIYLLPLYMV